MFSVSLGTSTTGVWLLGWMDAVLDVTSSKLEPSGASPTLMGQHHSVEHR